MAAPAAAEDDFFKGRQIDFIINEGVGSGYDQWARLVARYMGQYLPGNPSFVPKNMPGGGSLTAANYMAKVAKRDGSVIGMMGRNIFFYALTNPDKVQFDSLAFNFVGNPEVGSRVCVAREGAPVRTAKELFDKELMVVGTGAGSAVSGTPQLLSSLLKLKFKIIEGYTSIGNGLVGMERGEVDGICMTIDALKSTRPGWLESGKVKVLFNTGPRPLPEFDAPTVFDFAKTDTERQVLSVYSSSLEIGRPIALPPEVPADRVALYRKAFDAVVEDAEFKAQATKMGLEITKVSGAELEKMIRDLMATPLDVVTMMDKLTK